MFKKILELLNKDLSGKTWDSEASHGYFGVMTYYGFKHNNNGYWESEININGSIVSVCINSPTEELPSNEHVSFVESIVKNPETLIEKIKPLMIKTLEEWKEKKVYQDWNQVFKLTGIEVPIDVDEMNDWEISYECLLDADGHHFTCCFKNGSPSFVTVDG